MSLRTKRLTLLLLIGVVAFNPAFAKPRGVCPEIKHDKVRQIYIFDGQPSELAYLAPDDSETAPDTYTLSKIYDEGRSVTIRCEYESATVRDIELKNRVRTCRSSESKTGEPRLTCK